MTYPRLTHKSGGVLRSFVLERSKVEHQLVAEALDFGVDGPDRWRVDWLAGGAIDRAAFASLDEAVSWVRRMVGERMGVAL